MADDSAEWTVAPQATPPPRRLLARRLLLLREAAGLTRDKAAKLGEMSSQTLWRLEKAQVAVIKRGVLRQLCDVYGVEDELRRELFWLAEESRKTGWWQSYGNAILDHNNLFIELEQYASRIVSFQLTMLPGLVQTADYRRAMARAYRPALSDGDVDRHLAVLAKRQERLAESSDVFRFDVLLSEAALRHRMGDDRTTSEQARHLLLLGDHPGVSIRVIPMTAVGWLGLQVGSFVLLEFPEHANPSLTEPPVVYVEGYTGALYLDKGVEIEQYRAAIGEIERVALGDTESRSLIRAIAEECGE
ncbi:helix-turn-helix domain-containing protein [Nocardia puris]|uniref:helix-turn-helix domain-containing protein n=1 Tax=Nocardia puris TaxID=208602 RepID=UPI001893D866|nr:helix-turn-helix transcriptional regulator [Nocardia puris]MBF6211090.1 helix-turn-helix domain-containing protein [Nocardia puris]MBF6364681.1 helix-turn-helix domain-containing protein [Nocardia puris]MBF6463109.1 helix-turn-helix domain-containing protein [Nocardia puris]